MEGFSSELTKMAVARWLLGGLCKIHHVFRAVEDQVLSERVAYTQTGETPQFLEEKHVGYVGELLENIGKGF